MGHPRITGMDASQHRQISFAEAVSVRLDDMRRAVDADYAGYGASLAGVYRVQRAEAWHLSDWRAFKQFDDRLTYLDSLVRPHA